MQMYHAASVSRMGVCRQPRARPKPIRGATSSGLSVSGWGVCHTWVKGRTSDRSKRPQCPCPGLAGHGVRHGTSIAADRGHRRQAVDALDTSRHRTPTPDPTGWTASRSHLVGNQQPDHLAHDRGADKPERRRTATTVAEGHIILRRRARTALPTFWDFHRSGSDGSDAGTRHFSGGPQAG